MVQGLTELENRWRRIPHAIRNDVRNAMEQIAEAVVRDARRLAPKGTSGDLVRSISWTWGDAPDGSVTIASASASGDPNAIRITIYAGNKSSLVTNKRGVYFQNARIQEFGARRGPPGHDSAKMWRQPTPFFFPAWRIWRRRVRVRLSLAMRKAIERTR